MKEEVNNKTKKKYDFKRSARLKFLENQIAIYKEDLLRLSRQVQAYRRDYLKDSKGGGNNV